MINWHKADLENRMYVNVGDGKKAAMPRYYKDKMYNTEEREKISVVANQKQVKILLDEYEKSKPQTYYNNKAAVKAAFERMNAADTKNKV